MARDGTPVTTCLSALEAGDRFELLAPRQEGWYDLPAALFDLSQRVELVEDPEGNPLDLDQDGRRLRVESNENGPVALWLEYQGPGRFRLVRELLLIQQAKLLIKARIVHAKRPPQTLDLVWDPLIETIEAPLCPNCQRPGYLFEMNRLGQIRCRACPS